MPYFPSHLKKALTRILEYPLTLIEADSGCGKSTAVQACFLPIIAKDYRQYIYTSLGASAEKSWKGICELLGNVDPQAARYLEAMGVPDRDTMSEVAYQISNLICDSPTVLYWGRCADVFQGRCPGLFPGRGNTTFHQ